MNTPVKTEGVELIMTLLYLFEKLEQVAFASCFLILLLFGESDEIPAPLGFQAHLSEDASIQTSEDHVEGTWQDAWICIWT